MRCVQSRLHCLNLNKLLCKPVKADLSRAMTKCVQERAPLKH